MDGRDDEQTADMLPSRPAAGPAGQVQRTSAAPPNIIQVGILTGGARADCSSNVHAIHSDGERPTKYELCVQKGRAVHKPTLTLYRMVMPIGTPFLKEKINN